jgi:hypothetical protein
MELSRQRAAAVVGWLMHFGLGSDRIEARGYGFTRLKVRGKGPDLNRVNRRVAFTVVKPAWLRGSHRRRIADPGLEGRTRAEPEQHHDP